MNESSEPSESAGAWRGGRQAPSDDAKRLMAAILELSALLRRPEPRASARTPRLGLARIAKENDLEQRHMSALLTVALYEPITVTQLAERQRVALNTASLVAVELERAGLLERREDPSDRRRTILTVAPRKHKLVQEGLDKRAARLQRTLDRLTPAQRDGLLKGLESLAEEM